MTLANDYTMICSGPEKSLTSAYEEVNSAKVADTDVQIVAALRKQYPELNLTVTTANNVPLLYFANLGFATADLDTTEEEVFRWRGYFGPRKRGEQGSIGDATFFAKYHYRWANEDFILYTILIGYTIVQYVLKEPGPGEDTLSHCAKTDAMMLACVTALTPDYAKYIWVYDRYWYQSTALWDEVQKASWHDVILNPKTKKSLTKVCDNFFDAKDTYAKFGVAWKRGLIFHGPVGNGKTVSIKALMHTMYARKPAVPTLYVKDAPSTYNIASVFAHARNNAPCLLIMEDIETIVNQDTRSYFFNEVDGLASNDGILMVASTNFLDKLDPGLAKRPSRFDRLFNFPLPDKDERTQYANYWRKKITNRSDSIDFPEKLCPAIADITNKFSFAFMQEAFVSTLLAVARGNTDDDENDGDSDSEKDGDIDVDSKDLENGIDRLTTRGGYESGTPNDADIQLIQGMYEQLQLRRQRSKRDDGNRKDPLDEYLFWRVIRKQVSILRENLDSGDGSESLKSVTPAPEGKPRHAASTAFDRSLRGPCGSGIPAHVQKRMQGPSVVAESTAMPAQGEGGEGHAMAWTPDMIPKLAAARRPV